LFFSYQLMKNFIDIARLGRNVPNQRIRQMLGKKDLPSIRAMIDIHLTSLTKNEGLKGTFTSDPSTIEIVQKVLMNAKKNGADAKRSEVESRFFRDKIFSQPNLNIQEAGSIMVLISDINDFPIFNQQYKMKASTSAMICVGGPAAEDQIVISSIINEIRTKLDRMIYIIDSYQKSNVSHSAKQLHARHGTALNSDESLSGHRLLPVLLLRSLIGINLKDVLEPDYKKIDVEFTIDPKKLRIYFGNELNWLKQEYRKRTGRLTEHDVNRVESVLSQQILIAIESHTGVQISGGLARAKTNPSSIHVTFNTKGSKQVAKEHGDLAKVGIVGKELSAEKKEAFFGQNEYILDAFEYEGDSHILFNAHQINQELAEQRGATWIEGKEIERILIRKNEQGNAELVGVTSKDGEYFYCNRLHFTGGYRVEYHYDPKSSERFESSFLRNAVNKIEDIFGLQNPLNNNITTATGVSVNAVFNNSERLKKLIDEYGSTGEIAVTNSHWTMIACNEDHIVMRMTGGGNTGSEEYCPEYFLNLLANTRRIFGDDLIGILSTYGCPRAVNAKNSTEFAKIAEGIIISYGKGGTGNTKRHIEAAFGLMMLGFKKEVVEFFNQFYTTQKENLGDQLLKSYEMADEVGFFSDNSKKTNRRMGYDDSLSTEEKLMIGGFITILSIGLACGLIKNKEKKIDISR
jgi:hypothetical protein